MKAKLLFATLILGTLALAADPVSFARSYKVGDKSVYTMDIKMTGKMSMAIGMDSTQTVTKVYDNGDADIETATSNMTMNGSAMPGGGQKPITMRMSKYGVPVGNVPGQGGRMNFAKYASFYGDGSLEMGKVVQINDVDKDNPKNTVKGTVELEGQEGSLYKITSHLDVTSTETGDTPMHVDVTSWVANGGKLDHSTAKITNVQFGQMAFDSIEVTMTAKG